MSRDLSRALEEAIAAAREAGELLRADFHRSGRPARSGSTRPTPTPRPSTLIRARLLRGLPRLGLPGRGDRARGRASRARRSGWWTRTTARATTWTAGGAAPSRSPAGARGGRCLGVVFAFAYPDDDGDLFAWAEGCGPAHAQRRARRGACPTARSGALDVVLVSSERRPRSRGQPRVRRARRASAACRASRTGWRWWPPARRRRPSRSSPRAPGTTPAGHALLRGGRRVAGRRAGREVGYGRDGESRCACAPSADAAPVRRERSAAVAHARRRAPERHERLTRAARAGQRSSRRRAALAGAGLPAGTGRGRQPGRLVEFESAAAIARRYPDGPRALDGRGPWDTLAGQPTDDSEMALALARSIVAQGRLRARGGPRRVPRLVRLGAASTSATPPAPRSRASRAARARPTAR